MPSGQLGRLPILGDLQVREHVEEVMAIVELDKIRGSIVGYPGQSGLSVEQRKRLSIGAQQQPQHACKYIASFFTLGECVFSADTRQAGLPRTLPLSHLKS